MKKDILILVSGFLSSLLLFLMSVGIEVSWFNETSISAFTALLGAFGALVINLYSVWKNTYVSQKAQAQKRVLKRHDMIK